jgi:flagellar protein FliT
MPVDTAAIRAAYEALAELSAQALRHTRERDWEAFAALREREAALLAQLQAFGRERIEGGPELAHIEALIRRILDTQRQAQALLAPWRDEVAAQLRSTGSSRKLAQAYGEHALR